MSSPSLDPDERKSIQSRIDLLQKLIGDYRTRAYQMVLAHAGLTVAIARYIEGRPGLEILACAICLFIVTLLLLWWLWVLMKQSDKGVRDAKYLYKRLRVVVPSDRLKSSSKSSCTRLWGPVKWFPFCVMIVAMIWMLVAWYSGSKRCCHLSVAPHPDVSTPTPTPRPTPS